MVDRGKGRVANAGCGRKANGGGGSTCRLGGAGEGAMATLEVDQGS